MKQYKITITVETDHKNVIALLHELYCATLRKVGIKVVSAVAELKTRVVASEG